MGAIQRRRRRLRHTQATEPDGAEQVSPERSAAGPESGHLGPDQPVPAQPVPDQPAPAQPTGEQPPRPVPARARPEPALPKPEPARRKAQPHRPSPYDLAELSGAFALTAGVHDPDPGERGDQPDGDPGEPDHQRGEQHDRPWAEQQPVYRLAATPPENDRHDHDEVVTERGLRGLVGGGSSQVSVAAAMRARDAARPTDADVAAAETDLVIVRRGWVPREDLPRPGRR